MNNTAFGLVIEYGASCIIRGMVITDMYLQLENALSGYLIVTFE